jgi:alginate O-acetyltransferase complex protein AlgJ
MPASNVRTPHNDPLSLPAVPTPAPDGHRSRDVLVAVLFIAAIALPGLALFVTAGRTTTAFENRPAAPWPAWSAWGAGAAADFTASFERAFADRFGGRDVLIGWHHSTEVRLFRRSPASKVLVGRDGWLYYLGDDAKALDRDFRRFPAPSMRDAAAIATGVEARVRYLAQRGIGYLLVVVPDKYTIYPEYVPRAMQPLTDRSPLDVMLASLPADVRLHVLDLRPALVAAKPDRRLYFLTDSHWNANGAWVGYREIVAALRNERAPPLFPPEKVVGTVSGDLAVMIGATSYYGEPSIALDRGSDEPRCARSATGEMPAWGAPGQILHCASASLASAIIFYDSMANALMPLLANDFRESRWIAARAWDLRELAELSPTIVIDEIVERNLAQLADVRFLSRPANQETQRR